MHIRWWSLLPVILMLITGVAQAADSPYYHNSFALLIGINDYEHVPKLQYAVNDVMALREVLTTMYGFPAANITTLTEEHATKDNIIRALAQVTSKQRVGKDDRILIYYSGHGQTVPTADGGAKGFLIPVDAEVNLDDLTDPAPYLATCVPMNTVWETLDLCPAKHVLIIADACYSGLMARPRAIETAEDVSVGVLASRPARQVMTGGGKGQQTWEKPEWGHGAFTYKLLQELKARAATPGKVFTVKELYNSVFRAVTNLTEGKQTPQIADKDTEGEFLFLAPGNGNDEGLGIVGGGDRPASTQPYTPMTPGTESPATGTAIPAGMARLSLDSAPKGARVSINGKEVTGRETKCTIDIPLQGAATREVHVTLTLPGYRSQTRAVTLKDGKTTTISVLLEDVREKVLALDGAHGPIVVKLLDNDPFVMAGTISAWIKCEPWPAEGYYLITKSAQDNDFQLRITADGKLKFSVGHEMPVIVPTPLQPGRWYHVVGTYQAKKVLTLYLNGHCEASEVIAGQRNANDTAVEIGGNSRTPGQGAFHGQLAQLTFWNCALSAQAIATLFNRPPNGMEDGLVFACDFDGMAQNTVKTENCRIEMPDGATYVPSTLTTSRK